MKIYIYNLDDEVFVAAENKKDAFKTLSDYDYDYDHSENSLSRLTSKQLEYYDFMEENGDRISSFKEQLDKMIKDEEKFPAIFAARI